MLKNNIKRFVLFVLLVNLSLFCFGQSKQRYKISDECFGLMTKKAVLLDKEGNTLKEWSKTFTRILGPSKEDSLFVAEISYHASYVCLNKDLDIVFSFPLGCTAKGFENGFSIITRGLEREGAVNREGKVVFLPEHEIVYTHNDGNVVAGDPFRLNIYYKFRMKDQKGNDMGEFLFCLPRYTDNLFEVSIHDSKLNCLVRDNLQFEDKADEISRFFIKALQKHLRGNFKDALRDYKIVLQRDSLDFFHESALYNYLSCRHTLGLDNTYEKYPKSEFINNAAIDGLFGTKVQDSLKAEEQNNLFKNGLGVIFTDIKPLPYRDSLKFEYIPFYCIGNRLYYESASGEGIRIIEDLQYQSFKDRVYFDDYQSKKVLTKTILKEKEIFVSTTTPLDWQYSKKVLYVSFKQPNEIVLKSLGGDYIEMPRTHSDYLTNIISFMKKLCETYDIEYLVLAFPLP